MIRWAKYAKIITQAAVADALKAAKMIRLFVSIIKAIEIVSRKTPK